MSARRCQRLVIVVGSADPLLERRLSFVGLRPVHHGSGATVWAPIDWEWGWLDRVGDPGGSAACSTPGSSWEVDRG